MLSTVERHSLAPARISFTMSVPLWSRFKKFVILFFYKSQQENENREHILITTNEVPIDFVNGTGNGFREHIILHGVGGDFTRVTHFTRVTLPSKGKSFLFQPASLECVLSITNWKDSLFGHL